MSNQRDDRVDQFTGEMKEGIGIQTGDPQMAAEGAVQAQKAKERQARAGVQPTPTVEPAPSTRASEIPAPPSQPLPPNGGQKASK